MQTEVAMRWMVWSVAALGALVAVSGCRGARTGESAEAGQPLLSADEVEEMAHILEHLRDPGAVTWAPAAAILTRGEESCIDGRSERAVLGSPGGDTGELLAALAAWEEVAGVALDPAAIEALMADFLLSFGTFYIHSDDHALEALGHALEADPRVASLGLDLGNRSAVHDLLVDPRLIAGGGLTDSAALEDAIDALLALPAHVGCGHLRLMLERPEQYGVRPGLATAVLRAVFRAARRRPGLVDFEQLHGEHSERAVVLVRTPEPIHAHTLVPSVIPLRHEVTGTGAPTDHAFFVHHPGVAAFMRAETRHFVQSHLKDASPRPVSENAYRRAHEALAERHLRATLGHLAAAQPVFAVEITREASGQPRLRVALVRALTSELLMR